MEKLFDAEYRLMEVLWEHAPINSTQLVAVCAEVLEWNKSTTYTVLRKLKNKGMVHHEDATVSVLVLFTGNERQKHNYGEKERK